MPQINKKEIEQKSTTFNNIKDYIQTQQKLNSLADYKSQINFNQPIYKFPPLKTRDSE